MKKVLLVTDGIFHPPFFARQALRKSLAGMDSFEFRHVSSMEKLPGSLGDFSALVIYLHHKKISAYALARLDEFVSNGGGVLGIHAATASFKQEMRYFDIIGGKFTGHGPVESFEVKPVVGSDIFAGIPSFSVRDELYIHEPQPGIRCHFTVAHNEQQIPAVWTYQYGNGRVCYAVPGHRTETMHNQTYQKVLQRGLSWVCGE